MNNTSTNDICPICGGPLTPRQVEKLLRGGAHTAVVRVMAEVCQRCGERVYPADAIRRFEEIREKLAQQNTDEFVPIGQSFEVLDLPRPTAI